MGKTKCLNFTVLNKQQNMLKCLDFAWAEGREPIVVIIYLSDPGK